MASSSQNNQPPTKLEFADSGLSSSNLRYRRIVVKAGTGVLTSKSGLDSEMMSDLVRQLCAVRAAYGEVLLVTSGAIAAGRSVLGETNREIGTDISSRQVFAAVGQTRLMHTYQEMFAAHGAQTAQTLLTIPDLSNRQSYLNVGNLSLIHI